MAAEHIIEILTTKLGLKSASFISQFTLFAITDLIKQEKPNLIHG